MTPHERYYWETLFGGRRPPPDEPRPKPGYQNAVRPPWAPPEPPPLQLPPPLLPGLVDLAEQSDMVVEVIRCPKCGVFFEDWVCHPNGQFEQGLVTVAGCSCPTPNTYALSVARKYGFLP